MEQGGMPVRQNRFIFKDEFYDNLGINNENNNLDENKVSYDIPEVPLQEEKIENGGVSLEEKVRELPKFFGASKTNVIVEEQPEELKIELELPSFELKSETPISEEVQDETIVEEPQENYVSSEDLVVPNLIQPKPPEVVKTSQSEIKTQDIISAETSSLEPTPMFEKTENENINNFNVDTGINTNLEQEIMKSKVAMEARPTIVQNSNTLLGEEVPTAYRARRNNPTHGINNLREEIKLESEKIETPRVSPLLKPSSSKVIITERDINPQIINIDLELAREAKLQERVDNAETDIVIEENFDVDITVTKSNLLEELAQKEQQTGKISILARYGDDFCSRDYITNPAIGRNEEIKQLILILLTPEKSGILVGKPGIGKTSIVEGLAYRLQRGKVPEALKGYRIVSVKTTSLLGTLPTGETRLQTLIDELKELDKIILFVDEIHMLMGATSESSLDFANMFKESLGRGSIKMIGATTTEEYERYVLRDKAFVRRFQRVDVEEPTREQTIQILMGTLPKIEKNTGASLKYTDYIQSEIMAFIVDITTEYKRIYGIGSRYPDICITLLTQAFSQAVFDNRKDVNILDIRNAIENSKNIYPDVIRKELINFDNKFRQQIEEEKAM